MVGLERPVDYGRWCDLLLSVLSPRPCYKWLVGFEWESSLSGMIRRHPVTLSITYFRDDRLSDAETTVDERLRVDSYKEANRFANAPGIVRRKLLLFDELAQRNSRKKLASGRKSIAPERG